MEAQSCPLPLRCRWRGTVGGWTECLLRCCDLMRRSKHTGSLCKRSFSCCHPIIEAAGASAKYNVVQGYAPIIGTCTPSWRWLGSLDRKGGVNLLQQLLGAQALRGVGVPTALHNESNTALRARIPA